LEQSFTARMPSIMATSTLRLEDAKVLLNNIIYTLRITKYTKKITRP